MKTLNFIFTSLYLNPPKSGSTVLLRIKTTTGRGIGCLDFRVTAVEKTTDSFDLSENGTDMWIDEQGNELPKNTMWSPIK